MKPVYKKIIHDPSKGLYGDCVRACVASLLDLEAEQVPHFMEGNPGDQVFMDRLFEFLRPLGLYPLAFPCNISQIHGLDYIRGNYLMAGWSDKGIGHMVIATGRFHVVHDPNPMLPGCKPDGEGNYWIYLFVRLL